MPDDATKSLVDALIIHVSRMEEIVEHYCNEYHQALVTLRLALRQLEKRLEKRSS